MTHSIIGLDRDSGEIGVATQSQAFAVGGSVPFAVPGHGVIATQSMAEPMYGSIGLDLLLGGFSAEESLVALRSVDPSPERRQVAIADVSGRLAVYTGQRCVAAAGHVVAEDCMALADMVHSAAVWEAMAPSLSASTGPLVHRLLGALHSAARSSAPEFVAAVRRFGAAGLVPAPLAERLLET